MEIFFATCPRGLEQVLAQEFHNIGGQEVRETSGGVECQGPFPLCYRLNLRSRIASRILWRVGQCVYRHEEDLYHFALQLPWLKWFSVNCRIKVRLIAQKSPLASLEFSTLRIKDAICDRFVRETKKRPIVDKRHPDIQVVVFVDEGQATWYLDTTGAPLFQRGWRKQTGAAPLRENLAAGILCLAGWTGEEVLLDPMCGAGTFVIEAAMMSQGILPGGHREFGFRQLKNFDQACWDEVRQEVYENFQNTHSGKVFGYDQNVNVLAMASNHVQALGLDGVRLQRADVLDIMPPAKKGILIMNPPYGIRMGDSTILEQWYPQFGDMLKQRFAGWMVYILTADFRFPKLIRLAPSRKIPLFNGALECRLYEFRMVEGGNRKSVRMANQHRMN